MANLALNQNSTFMPMMIGMVTLDPQPNTIPAQLYPSSTATVIVAGCAVKLVSNVGPNIQVDVCTGVTDGPIYGVIPYNLRKNTYVPGDSLEVVGAGGVLLLKASAAVVRGAWVSCTNPTVATNDPTVVGDTTVNDYLLGKSLGQVAAASGSFSLIKVQVLPGINSSTGVVSLA